MLNFIKKYHYIIIPFLTTLFYGVWGKDITDQGFIRGYAWRMYLGQMPYLDFIYARPPLSPILQSLFYYSLPLAGSVIIERFRFYLFLYLANYLSLEFLKKRYLLGENTLFYVVISFLISAGAFAPMAWHTVDGIFLSVLSIYILDKVQNKYILVSGVICFLACMTKQSFYPLPFFMSAFILFDKSFYGKRIKSFFLFALSFLFSLSLFLISLKQLGLINGFIDQTVGATKFDDFLHAAFEVYFFDNLLKFLIGLIILIILDRVGVLKLKVSLLISTLIVIFYYIYQAYNLVVLHDLMVFLRKGPQFLLIISVLWGGDRYFKNNELSLLLCASVSWCASLSWGATYPTLLMAPLLLPVFSNIKLNESKKILITLLLLIITWSIIVNLKRYREPRIYEISKHLGSLDNKYFGILSSDDTYKKFIKIKHLNQKYGKFALLPHFPDADFYLNQYPVLKIDWALDVEIGRSRNKFLNDFCDFPIKVLFDKDFLNLKVIYKNIYNIYSSPNKKILYEDSTWLLVVFNSSPSNLKINCKN